MQAALLEILSYSSIFAIGRNRVFMSKSQSLCFGLLALLDD